MGHHAHRLTVRPDSRAGMRRRHVADIHEFDVEDQIRLGGNPRIGCVRSRAAASTIGKLPRNKEPTLAADFHSREALVEAGDDAAEALRKADWLAFVHLGLAIGVEFRLAVFAYDGSLVVVRRVELVAVGGEPASVVDLINLVWLDFRAGADANLLVAQGKSCSQNAMDHRDTGRQLYATDRGGWFGGGCGRGGLGGSLSKTSGGGRQEKTQKEMFHCANMLRFVLIGSVAGAPSPPWVA